MSKQISEGELFPVFESRYQAPLHWSVGGSFTGDASSLGIWQQRVGCRVKHSRASTADAAICEYRFRQRSSPQDAPRFDASDRRPSSSCPRRPAQEFSLLAGPLWCHLYCFKNTANAASTARMIITTGAHNRPAMIGALRLPVFSTVMGLAMMASNDTLRSSARYAETCRKRQANLSQRARLPVPPKASLEGTTCRDAEASRWRRSFACGQIGMSSSLSVGLLFEGLLHEA